MTLVKEATVIKQHILKPLHHEWKKHTTLDVWESWRIVIPSAYRLNTTTKYNITFCASFCAARINTKIVIQSWYSSSFKVNYVSGCYIKQCLNSQVTSIILTPMVDFPTRIQTNPLPDCKGFWRWCITLRITGFLDLDTVQEPSNLIHYCHQ
jgi:hypothetical protein